MSAQKPFDVAIIGGGISGLVLAIGLSKQTPPVPFHIYEAAHHFGEIGAGVALGPNARRAMSLIHPSVRSAYAVHACNNLTPGKEGIYFQYRMGMDGRGAAEGRKAGELVCESGDLGGKEALVGGEHRGMSIVHRAHFLEELVKLVDAGRVSFGKRVGKIEQDAAGVVLHFANGGESVRHSCVVGCDGIKSDVRREVWGEEYNAVFSGKYTYRGLLPMEKAVGLLGEKEEVLTAQNYIGHYGHVLTMPIEKGTVLNVVAFRTAKGEWKDERWVVPMEREHLMRDFQEWGGNVKKVLSLMEKTDMWALFEDPPLPQYWKGRIAVIGDAAHATTPHQGAGAGMAIEDAYVISALLGLAKGEGELEAAFKAYDAVRRERSQKLVTTSHNAGETYELHGEGIGDDLEKFTRNMHKRYDWIWEEDVSKELEQAKEIFEDLRTAA